MQGDQPHDLVRELARHFPLFLDKLRSPGEAQQLLDDYVRYLADIPRPLLAAAVQEAIQTSSTPYDFPTVGKLRKLAAERMLHLPGEADALAQIEARQRWTRTKDGPPPELHPLVRRALDLLGGFHAFRSAEEPTVVRGQFGRLYRDLRSQAVREVQVGSLRALTARSGH